MIDLTLKLVQDRPGDSARYYEPVRPANANAADRWHLGLATYRLAQVAVPRDGGEPIVTLERQTAKGRDYLSGARGRRVLPLSKLHDLDAGGALDEAHIRAHTAQVRDALIRVYLDEARSVAVTEVARHDVDYRAGDRTLFPADPSTEHMLPSLAGDLDLRVVARVGAVQLTRDWQRVLDQRSGLWVEVRRASCGGDCECAGEVRLTEQPDPQPEPASSSWGGPAATIPVDESAPMLDDNEADAPEGTLTHWQPCSNECGRHTLHRSGVCATCRKLDAVMREQMAEHPEHEAEPASASIVPTDCKVCGQEIEPSPLVPAGEEPLWQHVDPSARREPERQPAGLRWPDATLALTTVGELRALLLRAVEAGATVADDDSVIVEQLIRELPVPPEERAERGLPDVDVRDVSALKANPALTGEEVRAVAFGELPATRAECGCLRIEGEIRHVPACARVGVLGYDPFTHEAITDPHVIAVLDLLRSAVDNGVGLSLDAEHTTSLGRYLRRGRR